METIIIRSKENIDNISTRLYAFKYRIGRKQISFKSVSEQFRYVEKLQKFFDNPDNVNYCKQCDKSVSTTICDTCGGTESKDINIL